MSTHACWTSTPVPHPWEEIKDMSCGYEKRLEDTYCRGCHRARKEGPEDQLREHNAMGDAARGLSDGVDV